MPARPSHRRRSGTAASSGSTGDCSTGYVLLAVAAAAAAAYTGSALRRTGRP